MQEKEDVSPEIDYYCQYFIYWGLMHLLNMILQSG